MKSSSFKFLVLTSLYLFGSLGAQAARLDMKDPRRALAREDDVRIDAQVLQTELSTSSPLSVTYQIHNLTDAPIAVADKTSSIDYDPETNTIVFSIGAEVPDGKNMPHMVVIRSNEKKVFSAGGTVHVATPRVRTPWSAVPRYVQIKVVILRNVSEFASLIDTQTKTAAQPPLPNELFGPVKLVRDPPMLRVLKCIPRK